MIPEDAWPAGDRLAWDDDDTFTHYDFTTEPWTETPYTAEERAPIEARLAEEAAAEEAHSALEAAAAERARLRDDVAALMDEPPSAERTAALVDALAELVLNLDL